MSDRYQKAPDMYVRKQASGEKPDMGVKEKSGTAN
jgi:hypothetical protein